MTDDGDGPLCARCGDGGTLYPARCAERPERLKGLPIGMYHCPDCGAMLLAGYPHGDLCELCRDGERPSYDKEASDATRPR